MNKLTFVFVILIISFPIVPYWTGIEAEQQLYSFNQAFYHHFHVQPLEESYQRGWFHSYAQSIVKIPESVGHFSPNHRLVLVHEIDHGFLPVQSALIQTRLHTDSQSANQTTLLQIQTMIQGNGDSVSTLQIAPLVLQEENVYLQLANLQGEVYVKRHLPVAHVELQTPRIQLADDATKTVMQQVGLKMDLPLTDSEVMSTMAHLTMKQANILPREQQLLPLRFEGIRLVSNNTLFGEYVTTQIQVNLKQFQVGTSSYGSSSGNLELRHWHVPTLSALLDRFISTRLQNGSASPTILGLMPYGLTLLKHRPEIALTHLNVNTPTGTLFGTMQVKFEPTQTGYFALLNPLVLLNGLQVQLEMRIPKPVPEQLQEVVRWVKKVSPLPKAEISWNEIEEQEGYVTFQLQLAQGILQLNGLTLPITQL